MVAEHLRQYQQWIATPQPATQQHLHTELDGFLTALASGNHDALPRVTELTRQPTKKARNRIVESSRTIVTGLLPVGSLIVLEALHVHIDPTAQATWLTGGLLWAFAYFAASDPLSLAKIATTREILGIFSKKSG
jgi:hypothetical protein